MEAVRAAWYRARLLRILVFVRLLYPIVVVELI